MWRERFLSTIKNQRKTASTRSSERTIHKHEVSETLSATSIYQKFLQQLYWIVNILNVCATKILKVCSCITLISWVFITQYLNVLFPWFSPFWHNQAGWNLSGGSSAWAVHNMDKIVFGGRSNIRSITGAIEMALSEGYI